MGYKKLLATHLFDGYRFREHQVLILKDDGTVEDIVDIHESGDDVQLLQGILSPGFVNCHCHIELSHLKGYIPENTGLAAFVRQIVAKRGLEKELITQAIADADTEMWQNGIVAVGDICNTTDSLSQKQQSHLYYHNFIEAIGSDPTIANKNFAIYQNVYQQYATAIGAERTTIVPHAPYSVSEPLWEKILAHNTTDLFTIHNQETEDETLWFANKTGAFLDTFKAMGTNTSYFTPSGKSSLQTYLPKFSSVQQLLLVHNVFTTEEDITFSEQLNANLFWCFCPNANQYISQLLPNLPLFIKKNCKIVFGTDSLASNHQLSIWEEIKTLRTAYVDIPIEQMLQWATLNGAKALKIDNRYGSFEKGKKPGTVLIANDDTANILL